MATNAGGVRVLRYGPMRAQLRGAEAALSDGTVVSHLAGLVKDNTGYDYPSLLAGSEGTLATIIRATIRAVPRPKELALAVLGFDDVFIAADQMPWLLAHRPEALEGFDENLPEFARIKSMPATWIRTPLGGTMPTAWR